MTAISQRIPNFIGGVSQQADEKMLLGQVKDALNCYPDIALGMLKRPGGKFLGKLSGLTANTADNAAWFSILQSTTEKYIASVSSAGVLSVWNLQTGQTATINYPTGKQASIVSYLTAADYRSIKTLTINDYTYILNTEKTVTAKTAPTWNPNRQATIVVSTVDHSDTYSVIINGTTFTYTSPNSSSGNLVINTVMTGISNAITSGFTTKTIIDNTIYLTFSSNTNVSGFGGPDGKYLRVFQDSVTSITKLPEQAYHNQIVKVANSSAAQDDFYVKFVADSGPNTSGKGIWEETVAPNVSTGFNENTMPVALIRTSTSPLTFKATFLDGSTQIDGSATVTANDDTLIWDSRGVGDEDSNSHPTFVDNTITDIFLYNNRLGFLTEDNVSMSQAGDYYNFYHKSATTVTASDPIDLSCASIKPAIVRSVVPITQGLLLFSENQQFLMEAENGAWTPANCSISTIASYECDRYLKPVDIGSTVIYVSRNQSWARAFEIFVRGQRDSPAVTETTKIVPEWMPQSITDAVGSTQNGLWVASGRTSPYMYLHRFYEQGNERPMTAWFKWLLPSNVIHTVIQNDILYVLTSGTEGYVATQHKLVLAPSTGGLINSLGSTVDPHLDAWCEVTDVSMVSPVPPTAPSYSNTTSLTKVYLPTYFNTTKTIRFVVGLLKAGSPGTQSGYTNVAVLASDGGGTYFTIPGDVTGNYIYVGYEYNMELTLPRYYYSMGEQGVDFTAVTTTSRMAFYTGLGGDIYFSIRDRSRPEWFSIGGAQIADFYSANTSPFRDSYVYKVPIYQRPDNYTMKVTSNTPFPVSLVSMQWEGQYSPGFYRRT
jgi:hypothetical protein